MNDCVNAEIRDALPDLLSGSLDDVARGHVNAHVEGCADCRSELALLRVAREALRARGPRFDEGRIVGAIPPYGAARQVSFPVWRVAAGIMLIVGSSAVALLSRTHGQPIRVDTLAAAGSTTPELTMSGGLGDLDEADLRAVLSEIDHLDAVPSSDAEPVGLSVESTGPSSGGD